jgi:hypothetical protein
MTARNPFLDEGARVYFSQASILRSYLVLVGLVGLALLVWWPRESLVTALRTGGAPDSFAAAAIGLYVSLVYLGARYGSEAYAPDTVRRIREYVALTPIPIRSVVLGRAWFASLHTLFLLALGLPLLLASLAVSGLDPRVVPRALIVIGAATLAVRLYGFLLLILLDGHRTIRDLVLLVGIVAFLGLSIGLFPAANPIIALVRVSSRGAPAGGPWVSVILDLAVSCLLAVGAGARLTAMRRRARAEDDRHA